MKQVSPPTIAALMYCGPSCARKRRSTKSIAVSHALETTIGNAITRSSETPPGE
ncbi:MAG: hypothetical protein ACYS9X_21730 [Planctomycetota bacterium]